MGPAQGNLGIKAHRKAIEGLISVFIASRQ